MEGGKEERKEEKEGRRRQVGRWVWKKQRWVTVSQSR